MLTISISALLERTLYVYSANADPLGNIAPNVTRTVTVNPDPIGIISLNITSSSGDNFANASKNITVSLDTDRDDLGNFSGTFLGRSFTNTTSGGNATFTILVLPNDTNGNATFSINMTNSAGSTLFITNSDITDTDNSFVIIDTIKPMITLNGTLRLTRYNREKLMQIQVPSQLMLPSQLILTMHRTHRLLQPWTHVLETQP